MISAEIDRRNSQSIMAIRKRAGNHSEICPTCCNPHNQPHRRALYGWIQEGCIDACHSDKIPVDTDSYNWHMRYEARELRAKELQNLMGNR